MKRVLFFIEKSMKCGVLIGFVACLLIPINLFSQSNSTPTAVGKGPPKYLCTYCQNEGKSVYLIPCPDPEKPNCTYDEFWKIHVCVKHPYKCPENSNNGTESNGSTSALRDASLNVAASGIANGNINDVTLGGIGLIADGFFNSPGKSAAEIEAENKEKQRIAFENERQKQLKEAHDLEMLNKLKAMSKPLPGSEQLETKNVLSGKLELKPLPMGNGTNTTYDGSAIFGGNVSHPTDLQTINKSGGNGELTTASKQLKSSTSDEIGLKNVIDGNGREIGDAFGSEKSNPTAEDLNSQPSNWDQNVNAPNAFGQAKKLNDNKLPPPPNDPKIIEQEEKENNLAKAHPEFGKLLKQREDLQKESDKLATKLKEVKTQLQQTPTEDKEKQTKLVEDLKNISDQQIKTNGQLNMKKLEVKETFNSYDVDVIIVPENPPASIPSQTKPKE